MSLSQGIFYWVQDGKQSLFLLVQISADCSGTYTHMLRINGSALAVKARSHLWHRGFYSDISRVLQSGLIRLLVDLLM